MRTASALVLTALASVAMAQPIPPRTLVTLSSCGQLDGPSTVYLSPGGCPDPTEANVTARVKGAMTFVNLSCQLSAASGSATVAITARSGTCGSVADTTFACTIATSAQTCETAATFLTLQPGQCLVFKVATSGALPAPRHLICTLERSG